MIEILKSCNGALTHPDAVEPGCWVNVCAPTDEDFEWLVENLGVQQDFTAIMRDPDEISHVDKFDDKYQTLIVVDYPAVEDLADPGSPDLVQFDTRPLSIILMEKKDIVLTSSLTPCVIIERLKGERDIPVDTTMRTRFLLDILYEISQSYIEGLDVLGKQYAHIERRIRKKQRNTELLSMLGLEKSLLYMSMSLKGNAPTLEAIQKGRVVELYDDDSDLLDDVMIEFRQAIKMSAIYTDVTTKAMDAFSGVMSNNVNVSMGMLTVITLVLSIPTAVFSFYGMNTVTLPFDSSWVFPTLFSIALAAITLVIVLVVLWKK